VNGLPGLAKIGPSVLAATTLAACAPRPVHIPRPVQSTIPADQEQAVGTQEPMLAPKTPKEHRLREPDSRASVLRVLALFQSSIASGEPPLEELLTGPPTLSAPGADGRRAAPNRANIVSLLEANFIDRALNFDPLEVSVRSTDRGVAATVPLQATGTSGRRMLLALGLGYRSGALRIVDIALARAP
jgi:hypothetical protein